MAAAGAEALEQELSCPICLERYREPVSLDCGHSFCTLCIRGALQVQQSQRGSYSCPLCQTPYPHLPHLHKNFSLANIVQSAPGLIPCDYCLDRAVAAVKTCLSCEVALCQQHLGKHDSKLGDKGHTLLEPGSSLQGRKCPLHDKLLECYCQQDRACICMMCSIMGPHKGHNLSTLGEARQSLQASLSERENTLVKSESALKKGLEELTRSKGILQSNASSWMQQLQELFKDIVSKIKQKQEEMLCAVTSNETSELSKLEEVARLMEEKRDGASQSLQELQTIKAETDPLLFIKAYMSSEERFKSQDFTTENVKVLEMESEQPLCKSIRDETERYITTINRLLQPVDKIFNMQTQWFRAVPEDGELVPKIATQPGGMFAEIPAEQYQTFGFGQIPLQHHGLQEHSIIFGQPSTNSWFR